MHGVQEPQLRYDEEQEDDAGASRIQQVLQPLPSAHGTQRDEVNDEVGTMNDEVKTICLSLHCFAFIVHPFS
jgi:hypothetical protein